MWTSLEKNGSALKSVESTNCKLVDRENINLNFDISFAKIDWKLTELSALPGDFWEWPKYVSYQSENCRK